MERGITTVTRAVFTGDMSSRRCYGCLGSNSRSPGKLEVDIDAEQEVAIDDRSLVKALRKVPKRRGGG